MDWNQDGGERTHCWSSLDLPLFNVTKASATFFDFGNDKYAKDLDVQACGNAFSMLY